MIGLVLIIALATGWWALKTRNARSMRFGDVAAVVAALVGLRLFTRGEALPAIAAFAGVAYWVWIRRGSGGPDMSADQAARLLDVPADASTADVRAAHRRLIRRVHPDTGGSADLTAQVNAARDVLLARKRMTDRSFE